jgi:hypothetical protein
MLKRHFTLLFALLFTFSLAGAAFAQEAPAKKAKVGRWEGRVVRINKADSSLTVRKAGSTLEKTIISDASTKWVSQFHADKKVNDITPGDVKEEDYVICTGTWENAGALHATLISKRLSHSE